MTDLSSLLGGVRLRIMSESDIPKDQPIWWRVRDLWYDAPLDEYGDPIPGGSTMEIIGEWFTVVKETPKGAWLTPYGLRLHPKRFVLREVKKRYACPTLEEALESFIARKRSQRRIYRARMDAADLAVTKGEILLGRLLVANGKEYRNG